MLGISGAPSQRREGPWGTGAPSSRAVIPTSILAEHWALPRVTTPSSRTTLLWSNCPRVRASARKLSLWESEQPSLSVCTATESPWRPGSCRRPQHSSPNRPVGKQHLRHPREAAPLANRAGGARRERLLGCGLLPVWDSELSGSNHATLSASEVTWFHVSLPLLPGVRVKGDSPRLPQREGLAYARTAKAPPAQPSVTQGDDGTHSATHCFPASAQ